MMPGVPARGRGIDHGTDRGRALVQKLARELRSGRVDRGLSQESLARALGISRSRVSLVERGLAQGVDLVRWSRLLAAVGLELSAQTFPTGAPIRDAAHAALLARLRARLHPRLGWRTEVPLPMLGDLRGWDATIRGDGWITGVEAETRPRDLQALERRISLKQRDSGVEHVILLLRGSRYNRALLRAYGAHLAEGFPVPGTRALELLGAGVSPQGSAVVVL